MNKVLLTLFLLLILFPCFSKEIVVGVINDNPHYFEHHHNGTMKRQKTAVINIVKKELEKKFKHSKITIRYIDYDDSKLSTAAKVIQKQIKSFKPDIIFGPFLDKTFYFLEKTIEKSKVPFLAFTHTSALKKLQNYYTPFEWDNVSVKLILEKAKKMLKKEHLKIGVFVQLTDVHSTDTYSNVMDYVDDELFAVKFVHSKTQDYWSYKNKLDDDIKKMSNFSPDIIFNANSNDVEEISSQLIIKMIDKGFTGIFVDTGTWPCSEMYFERARKYLKNIQKTTFGLAARQKVCFMNIKKDEKDFRNFFVENDDKYYSSSGLLYKMLTHVLSSLLKSPLKITAVNTHKILQENPYFKGFSGEEYALYKTKDSPEFLNIYKYHFQKDLLIEKIPNEESLMKMQK